ncbi:hypothetical protein K1719_033492 [Acacia pycnantha]|nr:hypothetical protein K1719_033492 [Acacia pycnantha]
MSQTLLSDVNDSKDTWSVIAKVIRKWVVRKKAAPKPIWNIGMILADEMETRIEVSATHKNLINKLVESPKEGMVYNFQNFEVLDNDDKYRVTSHPWKFNFHPHMFIEECDVVITKEAYNFITFWNALTTSIRSKGGIILNVASSGIAATLLPSGRTAHSRNIDQASGLCNGTRLQVTQLGKNVIKAKALNGTSVGEDILIHRMDMNPSESKLPFKMTRRQFSIIISFAMTINKSQGQSMTNVGLYLPSPVFSHGQLYVALSRVKSFNGLKILILDEFKKCTNTTVNVVYREVFQNLMPHPQM